MSGVHPPPPPPRLWCGGRTHSLGGEGVGVQYFGRCQTQICTLLYICKYFVDFIYFWRSNKKQRSCDGQGGGARSAPFEVAMSSKRGVRAAHGRARAAKSH
jgi:hypothetical protein